MATTANVRIRPAEHADLLEILRIERESFPQPWPHAAFEQFIAKPGFLVATPAPGSELATNTTDVVLGYVVADTITQFGKAMGHIKDLAVHPAYRENGIGRQLLTRSIGILKNQSADQVKLEVRESNHQARALYDEFGFTIHRVHKAYYEDGENALILSKPL
jgi:ribosomal-protein-alanine N-acetyltransferase